MRRGFVLSILVLVALRGRSIGGHTTRPGEERQPHPWGGGPPPPGWFAAHRPQHHEAPLVVEPATGDDRQTHLRLPGSLIMQLSAGAVEDAPDGWAPTPTGTVVAGLALSVAVVLGGLWMIRRPKRRWLGAAITAATVAVVVGVAGCPPQQRRDGNDLSTYVECVPRLQVQQGNTLAGKALLEAGDGDEIRLTIDKDDLAAWAAKAGPEPASK